jgi:hypothetical protein
MMRRGAFKLIVALFESLFSGPSEQKMGGESKKVPGQQRWISKRLSDPVSGGWFIIPLISDRPRPE